MMATSGSVISAAWIEHQLLDHIKNALRVTIAWRPPAGSVARKRSTVQFALGSFARHLQRLMSIEEEGGYLASVAASKPNHGQQIAELASDHDRFRHRLQEICCAIDVASDRGQDDLQHVCKELEQLLADVDRHDRAEVDLLQTALLDDEGGEG